MICSACQIEITSEIKEHYQSELHVLNIKRKSNSIPPLHQLPPKDSSTTAEPLTKKPKERRILYKSKIPINECFMCNDIINNPAEMQEHCTSHGIETRYYDYCRSKTDEMRCIFCDKQIADKFKLKEHIRKYFIKGFKTEGAFGYLENGKIIGNREYLRYFEQTHRVVEYREKKEEVVMCKASKEEKKWTNECKKNDLKVSKALNHQKHFRDHWLQ